MTGRVVLVSCCGPKLDKASPAKDLYTSPLFKLSRLWVEQQKLPWWILSAKLGLVNPEEVIEPYDQTLITMKKWDRMRWEAKVEKQLKSEIGTETEIVALMGSLYLTALKSWKVIDLLHGLPIGKRLQRLKELTT